MIPKKIHYCWFGLKPIPNREQACIASWKKHMPDFELVLWDETRFDVNSSLYTKEAYRVKKFAFVSDYVRLYALLNEGGIYLDTDVEIVKPFHDFVKYNAFGSFETPKVVQTGVIGSVSNGLLIQKMFDYYKDRNFIQNDGSFNQTANTVVLTEILVENGLILNNKRQSLYLFEIFPTDYFCPINQATQEIVVTDNTYTIHYLSGSWLRPIDRFTRKCKAIIGAVFGFKLVERIRNFIFK